METEVVSARSEQRRGMAVPGWLREVLWLAGREIRRMRLSYLASGLFMLFMGLLAASIVDEELVGGGPGRGVAGPEGWRDAFPADWVFFILTALLATNFMSRDYFASWLDPFSMRLLFMRSLPISTGTMVASRMVSLSFALVFTVPAFFLPVYFFSGLGQLGWAYLWFVSIWVGYSLVWAGFNLYLELGSHGKTYTWISFATVLALLALIALLEWFLDPRIVGRVVELSQDHGPLAALVALAVGVMVFALLGRATERRVGERELPT